MVDWGGGRGPEESTGVGHCNVRGERRVKVQEMPFYIRGAKDTLKKGGSTKRKKMARAKASAYVSDGQYHKG